VILCDVMMPEMTGDRFHELLHAEVPEIAGQLVFMTGGAFTQQARDFLGRVPNQRMEKPLDLHDVRALIQLRLQAR
jgi:CheY-like chemotaxis protein